jgi:hypothetical protein
MDCDTTGIEPDFALVKFKKLAGGGYFKIVNESVPPALAKLGYDAAQIEENALVASASLAGCMMGPDAPTLEPVDGGIANRDGWSPAALTAAGRSATRLSRTRTQAAAAAAARALASRAAAAAARNRSPQPQHAAARRLLRRRRRRAPPPQELPSAARGGGTVGDCTRKAGGPPEGRWRVAGGGSVQCSRRRWR